MPLRQILGIVLSFFYFLFCDILHFAYSLPITSLLLPLQVASSTSVNSNSLSGNTADSSGIVEFFDPLPHPVLQYIEHYDACPNGCHFPAMRLACGAKEIRYDHTGCKRSTAVGAWTKR